MVDIYVGVELEMLSLKPDGFGASKKGFSN